MTNDITKSLVHNEVVSCEEHRDAGFDGVKTILFCNKISLIPLVNMPYLNLAFCIFFQKLNYSK